MADIIRELAVVETLDEVRVTYAGWDFPVDVIPKGSRGAVICVFTTPTLAYEVEFVGHDGAPWAIGTYLPHQLRTVP